MSLPHTFFAGRAGDVEPPLALLIAGGSSNLYVVDRNTASVLKTHPVETVQAFPAKVSDVVHSVVDQSYWHVTVTANAELHRLKLDGIYETTVVDSSILRASNSRGISATRNGYLLVHNNFEDLLISARINADGTLTEMDSISFSGTVESMVSPARSDGQTFGATQTIIGNTQEGQNFRIDISSGGQLSGLSQTSFGRTQIAPLPNGNAFTCTDNGALFQIDKSNLSTSSVGNVSTNGGSVESFNPGGDGNFYMFQRGNGLSAHKINQAGTKLANFDATFNFIDHKYLPAGFAGQTPAIAIVDRSGSNKIETIDPVSFNSQGGGISLGSEGGIVSLTTERPDWAWSDFMFSLADWSTYS